MGHVRQSQLYRVLSFFKKDFVYLFVRDRE